MYVSLFHASHTSAPNVISSISQIFGSFMAGLMVYAMYHEQIAALSATTEAAGLGNVFNGGAASIFCATPGAIQHNLGYLFMIEFFVDAYIGLVIWACLGMKSILLLSIYSTNVVPLDPANPFVSPSGAPFAIGLVYATMVWGYVSDSLNPSIHI